MINVTNINDRVILEIEGLDISPVETAKKIIEANHYGSIVSVDFLHIERIVIITTILPYGYYSDPQAKGTVTHYFNPDAYLLELLSTIKELRYGIKKYCLATHFSTFNPAQHPCLTATILGNNSE